MNYKNMLAGKKSGIQNRNNGAIGILIIIMVLAIAACGGTGIKPSASEKPAIVSTIEGSELKHIVLTEKAVARLAIETAQVRNLQVGGVQSLVIPYRAVIYDLKGDTWVYISPEPRTFIRQAIKIDHIDGDNVILKEGPALGTEVATVAVSELYGIDTGVGK